MLLGKLLISLSALAATPNAIAPFDPVEGFAPKIVKLEDPLGKGFDWSKQLPCGANRATVTVLFDKSFPTPKDRYMQVAKLWLRSEETNNTSGQRAAVVLKAPTDTWKLNALAWLEKVPGSESESTGLAAADLNRPMQIDFAWTPDGVVSVNFGGEYVKRTALDKPIDSIGFGVSYAKFEFMGLKVGRAGPPDPACDRRATEKSAQILNPNNGR